jgi:hypothetical protein
MWRWHFGQTRELSSSMCWEMCRANPLLSRWSLRWSLFADGYVAGCVYVYFELLVDIQLKE